MEAPVKGDFRLARCPPRSAGSISRPGPRVMVLNGAANRDPRRFTDPDEFRIERENAASTSPSAAACTAAPGARWPVWRPG